MGVFTDNAVRFATDPETRRAELRRAHVARAVRHLVAGDRAAAQQVMFDGLTAQAPLTFRSPA